MPQFDLAPKSVQQVNVVGQRDDNTALQIKQQGMQFVEQGVKDVVGVTRDKFKEMDEADMASARSAMLRIQTDENQELASTSNPADIKKIQDKYNKKYELILDGNEPLNGKPYFRNQSGKNAFKKGYVNKFNEARYIGGEKQAFELERRDTHAKYVNGIKSIIDQPEWNTPQAHEEINAYTNKLIEGGFYTAEEGKQFRADRHSDLDAERANKLFAQMESLGYDNGALDQIASDYKERINELDYLDQDDKNAYIKKADDLLNNKKKVEKARQTQIENEQKRVGYELSFKHRMNIANNNGTYADFMDDQRIPYSIRSQYIPKYNEERNAVVSQKFSTATANAVYAYDPSKDPTREMREKLANQVNANVSDANQRSRLMNYLDNQYGLDDANKLDMKSKFEHLDRALGSDVTVDKDGDIVSPYLDEDDYDIELEDGVLSIKGATQMQLDEMGVYIKNTYSNLLSMGQYKEAENFFNEEIKKVQTTKNNAELYDEYVTKKLSRPTYNTGRKK